MSRHAKNIAWNLIGLLTPLLAAIYAIPGLITELGNIRFGILSLIWIFVGYFSLFDLGLGRAVTQLAARKLGEGKNNEIAGIFWSSAGIMLLLGLIGGAIPYYTSSWIVTVGLEVPDEMRAETTTAFKYLALAIPLVVLSIGMQGIFEAYQRFGLLNLIRTPLGIYNFLGPLLVVQFYPSLDIVVGALIIGRFFALVSYSVMAMVLLPDIRTPRLPSKDLALALIHFGGWMTVTNVIGPLITYLDRFMIASMTSASVVAYYTTPHEMVRRLGLFPTAILGVFFPVFSTTLTQDRSKLAVYFQQAVILIFAFSFPVAISLSTYASPILSHWLNEEFSLISSPILIILLIGIFVNGFARIPYTLLLSDGLADLTAKIHLIQFVPYILVLALMVSKFGIVGAALTWTGRVVIEYGIFIYLMRLRSMLHISNIVKNLAIVLLSSMLILAGFLISDIIAKTIFLSVTLLATLIILWTNLPLNAMKSLFQSKEKPLIDSE